MASGKQTYPCVTAKSWWALRKKFNQSIPSRVTSSYLVSVLGGSEASVKANVLRGLKAVGLIDEDGHTTEKAKLWRDDAGYSEFCRGVLEEVYPANLRNALPGPEINKEVAKNWFMTTTGCGKAAASKMASMYALLANGTPSTADEGAVIKSKKTTRARSKGQLTPSGGPPQPQSERRQQDPPQPLGPGFELPEVRLNVEIRIDASVTPEQIDLIFASMAKHLYCRDDDRP